MEKASEKKSVYRVQGFTCTNCAATFEKNVKGIPTVENAQVNFGASKITVHGEASLEQLEKAGAFEGLKLYPENQKREIIRETFWKRRSTITTAISAVLLVVGWMLECCYYARHFHSRWWLRIIYKRIQRVNSVQF